VNIRKGDTVEVITGDDRTRAGRKTIAKVMSVLPDKGQVVVEGINRVYKHMKPSRGNPQGGRLSKEMPIDVSNVQLYCPTCKRGVRVGHRYDPADGHKERFCKKCKAGLGVLSKARPVYAAKKPS
jgi:large subunit ribosomal protein L24